MAVFPSQTLRTLFQNNIDYIARQFGVINDFLFGSQSDGNDVVSDMPFLYHTEEYCGCNAQYIHTGLRPDDQYGVFRVDIDGTGVNFQGYEALPYYYSRYTTAEQHNILENEVRPYIASYTLSATLDELGIDKFMSGGIYLRGYKNGSIVNYSVTKPFGIDTNSDATINNIQFYPYHKQTMSINESSNIYDPYREVRVQYACNIRGGQILTSIEDSEHPSNFILMPSVGSDTVYNVIDQSTSNTYNYNGDTVYNYFNEYGDIIINGGASGVPIVGGLCYNDFKLILDSLIDDLNLHFDFAGDGLEPLDYAPTLDEIRYGDYSDFYIEKLHQYDTLPSAPSFLGELQLDEYPKYLGTAAQSLLDLLPGVGLSALCAMCFLVGLITSKIRG